MNRSVQARAVLCAAMVAALAACSSPSPPSGPGSSASVSTPAAVNATPSATVKVVSFDETYRYPDGITVTVTAITHGQLGVFPETEDPDAKEGDPYTVVSASVRNATAAKFELIFQGTLRYGKDRTVAYRISLGISEENNGYLVLAPGEVSDPYDIGFLVPVAARDDVMLELQIDAGQHPPVAFVGSIATERS